MNTRKTLIALVAVFLMAGSSGAAVDMLDYWDTWTTGTDIATVSPWGTLYGSPSTGNGPTVIASTGIADSKCVKGSGSSTWTDAARPIPTSCLGGSTYVHSGMFSARSTGDNLLLYVGSSSLYVGGTDYYLRVQLSNGATDTIGLVTQIGATRYEESYDSGVDYAAWGWIEYRFDLSLTTGDQLTGGTFSIRNVDDNTGAPTGTGDWVWTGSFDMTGGGFQISHRGIASTWSPMVDNIIPEPITMLVLAVGGMATLLRRRR